MIRTATAFALVLATISTVCGQGGKPVVETKAFVSVEAPPVAPAEMASAADGIVLARYVGVEQVVDRSIASVNLRTIQSFEVVEVVKPDPGLPPPGERFVLTLPGGQKELPDKIVRMTIESVDPLHVDHVYVVFLSWPTPNAPVPQWGFAGLYDVTSGTVRGVHRGVTRHDGKPKASFLAEISTP